MEFMFNLDIETKEGDCRSWGNKNGENAATVGTWKRQHQNMVMQPSTSANVHVPSTHLTNITVKSNHRTIRPKKTSRRDIRLTADDPSAKMKPINNLPGQAPKSDQHKLAGKVSRCELCKVIYNSEPDKDLKKKVKINAEYIGCSAPKCDYWVHIHCAGYNIDSIEEIEGIDFLCPAHKDNNQNMLVIQEPSPPTPSEYKKNETPKAKKRKSKSNPKIKEFVTEPPAKRSSTRIAVRKSITS
ncbi:uncharacterized protein [Clytia hemisphaerica]|uniref:uncharacterized protein n=1 Tax=Clytia hemisphaerica TaxID=252671 RepID=UPI0034D5DDC3